MNESPQQINTGVEEEAKIIRAMVEQENSVQNNRLTWLMTIQGLLFAALGFAWDKKDAGGLVVVFCILGVIVSLIGWSSSQLSGKAYQELKVWCDAHTPKEYKGVPVICARGKPNRLHWILRPWRALPWIFALGWVAIFILNIRRA